MSRLGMLYALNEEDVKKLRSVPEEERYEYMLEEIEEALIGSPRSCELDKAWEGIQYCLGGGKWNEDNCIPTNIVFGGEVLVEKDDEIITLKNHQDVRDIVEYLHQNKLQEIIQTSVYKGYKQDKIEMRGDRAEMSDFPLYLNTVAGGLDRRDQTIGGFSFVVKIYAVPVIEIIE